MNDSNLNKKNDGNSLAMGIGVGLSLGTALGVALDNLALGISLGIAIGAALGTTGVFSNKSDDGENPKVPPKPKQ